MASKKPVQPANQDKTNQQAQTQIVSAQWSGPLPPPGALREFNDIIENGAERIMVMIEKEQQSRHEQEKKALEADIEDARFGKLLGAALVMFCIGAAIWTVSAGAHPAVSIAFLSVPVAALIGKFIDKRK